MIREQKEKYKQSIFDNGIMPLMVSFLKYVVVVGLTALGMHTAESRLIYQHVIAYEDITTLVKASFVDTNLIDASILEKETPIEQLDMVADAMRDQQRAIAEINQKNDELEDTVDELTQLNTEFSLQPVVTFSSPSLVIEGENLETTLQDYVVTIDGKCYYLETLLNTYVLDDEISLQDGVLQYAAKAAERKKVTDTVIHDNSLSQYIVRVLRIQRPYEALGFCRFKNLVDRGFGRADTQCDVGLAEI